MKNRNWQTRLIATCAILALVWLAYVAAGRITGWYIVRKLLVQSPNIGVMPEPVKIETTAKLEGKRIEQFGFSFQVPWNDDPILKEGKSVSLRTFKNGIGLIVFNPATQTDSARLMRDQIAKGPPEMARVLDISTFDSNYHLLSAELHVDRQGFVPWAAKDRLVRDSVLLPLKSGELADATAIYEINLGAVRGFQLGDPHTQKKIHLELFDAADRHYSIIMTGKLPLETSISQSEINAMVASIHPLPPPASTSQRFPG